MTSPVAALPFTVNASSTKLKFAKLIMGSLFYTADGKAPTESDDKTTFAVAQAISKTEIEDEKLFALNRLYHMRYQIDRTQNKINEVEIDGLHGYEIETKGTDPKDGKINAIYQVILFSKDSYYILFGAAQEDLENNMKMFKQLAESFKRTR